jgi:hypothetical protein
VTRSIRRRTDHDNLRARVLSRLRAELAVELDATIDAGLTFEAWLAGQPATLPDEEWLAGLPPTSPEEQARYDLEVAKSLAMTSKAAARGADRELAKLVAGRMNDPDLARWRFVPPPQPTRARRDYVREKPFEMKRRRLMFHIVQRARAIYEEESGRKRDIEPEVLKIAAELLDCSPNEIEEIKKHPPPPERGPPAPKSPTPEQVQHIFEFLWRKLGKAPSEAQLVEESARVLECSPDEIRAVIERGSKRPRPRERK